MRTRRAVTTILTCAAFLHAGCRTEDYQIHEGRADARAVQTLSGPAAGKPIPWHGPGRLSLELRRLKAFGDELGDVGEEISALHRTVAGKQREAFTLDEHERLQSMLFRYLVCREALWDVAGYYGESQNRFRKADEETRGFIIAFNAALQLTYYDTKLVSTFLDEPEAIAALNEAYAPCRIPSGTYDTVFQAVTSVEHLEAIEAAWELFSRQLEDPGSRLNSIARDDPVFGPLVADIRRFRLYSKAQTDRLLDRTAILFPQMENRLRQTKIAELAVTTTEAVKDGLRAGGALLGKGLVRLSKSPLASDVAFTPDQLAQIERLAQPGDIILTMREGYLTNIVIPGAFKHGIVHVGSPMQRRAAGLSKQVLQWVDGRRQRTVSENLFKGRLDSGSPADVIEAVAEGVILNSLGDLIRTPISRICILRPELPPEQRTRQLAALFARLNDPYDFKFNFVDDSRLCCTELVFRTLNRRGPIVFELVRRMGCYTLSADDILRTHFEALDRGNRAFSFVALAEEASGAGNAGHVLTGPAGEMRLRTVMGVPIPRADGAHAGMPLRPVQSLASNTRQPASSQRIEAQRGLFVSAFSFQPSSLPPRTALTQAPGTPNITLAALSGADTRRAISCSKPLRLPF